RAADESVFEANLNRVHRVAQPTGFGARPGLPFFTAQIGPVGRVVRAGLPLLAHPRKPMTRSQTTRVHGTPGDRALAPRPPRPRAGGPLFALLTGRAPPPPPPLLSLLAGRALVAFGAAGARRTLGAVSAIPPPTASNR